MYTDCWLRAWTLWFRRTSLTAKVGWNRATIPSRSESLKQNGWRRRITVHKRAVHKWMRTNLRPSIFRLSVSGSGCGWSSSQLSEGKRRPRTSRSSSNVKKSGPNFLFHITVDINSCKHKAQMYESVCQWLKTDKFNSIKSFRWPSFGHLKSLDFGQIFGLFYVLMYNKMKRCFPYTMTASQIKWKTTGETSS